MYNMFQNITSDTNIAYKLNIIEYLPYILLIIFIIILFIYGYIILLFLLLLYFSPLL